LFDLFIANSLVSLANKPNLQWLLLQGSSSTDV